jgi:putative ribosome biogenesis GTPase RsgA
LRADKRISQIDAGLINGNQSRFSTAMQKEAQLTPISSIKDLAEHIAKYNKGLNDTTIVYCLGDESELKSDTTKQAVRLMRQESLNPILVVKSKDLA